MEEIIDLITEILSTRWEFILSILMMAIGFIILLSSAKILLMLIAGVLILGGIALSVKGFRRS